MVQLNQKWDKILELFFEEPNKRFSIREISKRTKIPSSSVQRYLNELQKNGFITKDHFLNVNEYIRFRKTFFYIDRLYKSGLVEYFVKELNPSSITLFGSFRKGDSVKTSDIDIFVESSLKKQINLEKFEKVLKHKVDLFVEKDLYELQPNLVNNILNGVKLYGILKLK
tara:strand:+ start:432 stop:938 length:507 start_codon:yes stop_codon:yes gene_type:complete